MRLSVALVLALWCGPLLAAQVDELRTSGRLLLERAAERVRSGEPVPSDLVSTATDAVSASDRYSTDELARLQSRVDALDGALIDLAVDPALAGEARLNAEGRFEVGGQASFDLDFRPSRPVGPGSELIVAFPAMAPGLPQNIDPEGANFIEASAAEATFEPLVDIQRGIRGSLEGESVRAVFRLVEGEVPAGGIVTLRFRRVGMPYRAHGRYPVPLRIRFEPGAYAFEVPTPTLAVLPGEAAAIEVSAPPDVGSGERVPVTVRVTDRFGNLVRGAHPPFDVLVDGQFETSIPAGDDPTPVIEIPPLALGTHRIEVRSAGGGFRARTIVRSAARPLPVRWIEPHVYTERSGGLAPEPEIRAAYAGRVDTVLVLERDDALDGARWQQRDTSGNDGFVRTANLRAGGHSAIIAPTGMSDDRAPRLQYPSATSLATLPASVFAVALPEVPTDLRTRPAMRMRHVEILSGAASHEWFGRRIADEGARVSFTGSATSHDRGGQFIAMAGRTAVRIEPGESTLDALAAGRTWVTSGPGIVLDVETNGVSPGGRAPASPTRTIRGEVRGTAPIDRIELVRNGEVVDVRDVSFDPGSRVVRVSLNSDSSPVAGRYDLPRNGREWIGYVRLQGGELTGLDAGNLAALPGQAAAINPREPNRADFITWTRGLARSFYLELRPFEEPEGPQELEFVIRRGMEDVSQLPLYREPAEILPTTMVIGLQELQSGPVTRAYEVDGYRDTVTVKLVNREVADLLAFEFVDRRPAGAGAGDYYYVRVVQSDDHIAVSSPTFVGGFDPW